MRNASSTFPVGGDKEPNPGKAIALGNVALDTSLANRTRFNACDTSLGSGTKARETSHAESRTELWPVVLVFETQSLASVVIAPRGPPFGDTFEMPLLEDVAFKPTGPRDEDLGVSLLGDTPSEAETIPNIDGDFVLPNILLLGGGWVDALLKSAEIEANIPSLKDPELFQASSGGDPKAQSLLPGTLLAVEDPKSAKPGTPDSFSAPLVPFSPLFLAVVPVIPVVRAAALLAMPFSLYVYRCLRGFTAHVCVLNSSSWFLLLVSGSRYT